MSKLILLPLVFMLTTASAMAYEAMFPKTPANTVEIKQLPPLRALKHTGQGGDYFQEDNGLFMPLFRYIQKNDLAMTTPVESELAPATMKFFIGSEVNISRIASTQQIEVMTIPERTVLSVGIRGSYNKKIYQRALAQAEAWLEQNPNYIRNGEARMIYWNGPYIPGWFKRSELHLPIRSTSSN